MDAVTRTFRQLWRSTAGFKIRNLDDHVVLFVFNNQGDIDRILRSEPWCFDKHLVVFQQYDCDIPISELNFQWRLSGSKFMIFQSGSCRGRLLKIFVIQLGWCDDLLGG